MQVRRIAFTTAALLLGVGLLVSSHLSAAAAQRSPMDVAEVRPGMLGIGRTVFDGVHVEEFRVRVLGVLNNVIGPNRNLILAKLEGGPLANTGVIAGMSGSPVFIDGRLVGAVSYSLGSFPKEPIAGITPIAEMTDAAAINDVRPPGARVNVEFPLTRDGLTAAFRRALNWNRPFADRPEDTRGFGATSVDGFGAGQLGTLMRPIATPLAMSGFEPEVADLFGSAMREQGFLPSGGAATPARGELPFEGPLKPGDAIGVMLVSGDLQLGATGTVTHIDGDRVYAFGHPMYNLGPTEYPMTRAYVYTVLPSLFSSMKLSGTSEVIGTFLQDRATAVSGKLGPGPRMIPVTLTLESQRSPKRTFHFGVVNDQLFGPLMTYASILNTLSSYERQFGAMTFSIKGSAKVRNHDAIAFDNMFYGDQAPGAAAAYVAAPVTALMGNDYEKVDMEGIEATIRTAEEPRTATLERVWVDDPRPRAGRSIPLKILLRTYRGEEMLRTVPITIPPNASGSLSVLVADGGRLWQSEQREARTPQPRGVDQMIKTLNRARRSNTLYVKLLASEPGAIVNGELLSSLPPSVLGVLEGDRNGGNFNPVHSASLGEWEIATDHAVNGARTLTITVSQN
ncbi:MAG TPA: SpoIVB peptidase S55 domain-containing protein [Vicinamibacterales bacterium]|nr:SpoIVB peptidase S55 domain-containing protein [Vicinamibacterales bacterium]